MARLLAAGAVCASLLPSASAEGQTVKDYFSVIARGGTVAWDEASGMENTPFVALDAHYPLGRFLGLGTTVQVGRGNTRGQDFVTTLSFGDRQGGDTTSFFYNVQPVTALDLAGYAILRLPTNARLQPYAIVGGGLTSVFLDPQINRGDRNINKPTVHLGGGLWFRLTEQSGLQFDVRFVNVRNWNRDDLDPSRGRSPNTRFIEDLPQPPAAKNSLQNLSFSIGFRHVPGFFGDDN